MSQTPEQQAAQALISMVFIDAELEECRAQLNTLDAIAAGIAQLKAELAERTKTEVN